MPNAFPGTGHRYLVDFRAFKVTPSHTSDTSLTYVVLNSDGSAGETETVVIKTENIAPDVYLVTWVESNPDTAWPPERIALFRQWMDRGLKP